MTMVFLGIDGGGTKTGFVLVDGDGHVLARHQSSTSYYLEIGFEALPTLLQTGVQAVLAQAGLKPEHIAHAFLGLPAHGEDSALLTRFDGLLDGLLPRERCSVGNDMVCSWAGSLAGADGISVVAGTGSIAYGEWRGASARCGGWGELFGDEGSAYWLAREGLSLFSRMADGRAAAGPLQDLVRQHFQLAHDLDLCALINGADSGAAGGAGGPQRSHMAQLARLVSSAAERGDQQAIALLERAGQELAALVAGVAVQLKVQSGARLPISYTGGVFQAVAPVLEGMRVRLAELLPGCVLVEPRFGPDIGAAIHAARQARQAFGAMALERLAAFA